jgi:hypothetical protein
MTELNWRRPCSAGNGCVEIAEAGDKVYLRSSRDPKWLYVEFTQAEWEAFLLAETRKDQP